MKLASFEIPVLIAVPLTLGVCAYFQVQLSALLTLLVVVGSLVFFFASFEHSRMPLHQIMPIVVLSALGTAGRILFAAIPDVKPVIAITIIAGVMFGKRSGFMTGALIGLVSNIFFGQGPWTPWQMYSWGLVGYVSGIIGAHCANKPTLVYIWGFLGALLSCFVLNCWYIVGYINPITLPAALLAFGAALPMDATLGVATVVFLGALWAPWRTKLTRIKHKYELGDC